MIKVGINGFGRIGRMVFRAAVESNSMAKCMGWTPLIVKLIISQSVKTFSAFWER